VPRNEPRNALTFFSIRPRVGGQLQRKIRKTQKKRTDKQRVYLAAGELSRTVQRVLKEYGIGPERAFTRDLAAFID